MKAVVLAAGQGKRLLPLTASVPKCLVRLGGRSILEWQVRALFEAGVTDIAVVTGFHASDVEDEIEHLRELGVSVRPIHNPFFGVSDNLASCFLARHEMLSADGLVLLNGDTLFEPRLLRHVLALVEAPITVTIDRKDRYDSDDMKVQLLGKRLVRVGKTLDPSSVDGESIGLLVLNPEGAAQFVGKVDAAMREPEGLRSWFLAVIDRLADEDIVKVVSIEGMEWGEVDFPADLRRAEELTRRWRQNEAAEGSLEAKIAARG